jgi:hypothetical protein
MIPREENFSEPLNPFQTEARLREFFMSICLIRPMLPSPLLLLLPRV